VLRRLLFHVCVLLALLALSAIPVHAQAPAFQAAGTAVSGTTGVTPTWPAHQTGDIALLFMETQGDVTPTLTTASGFVLVGSNNAVNSAAGTRLTVFWARASSNAMAAPVIANTTDHVYAQILTYRRVLWSGNPWSVTAAGNKATASTTVTVTGVTPTDTNSLIVQVVTRSDDSAAASFSGQTNANLIGLAERVDGGTTTGNGGGFAVWDGVRLSNVATGNTTANISVSVVNAFRTLALRPARYFSRVAAGNWNTAATWSSAGCGGAASSVVPPAGADVTVCNGHTVTLNVNSANLNSLTIETTGVLNIGNDGNARTLTVSPAAPLPAGSIVNNGTLRYNTAANHVITTNGSFTNAGTFTSAAVAGTKTLTVTGLITNSGTFRFAGTAATTVNANGGFTNGGTFEVDLASNVTHVLNVSSTFTNNATVQFAPDADSLVSTNFTTGAPVIGSVLTGSAGSTTLYNATVNNSAGLTLSGAHNLTVLNTLTLTAGPIITGSNYVYVANGSAIGSAGGTDFVIGNLRKRYVAGANIDRVFEVGSGLAGAARYTPVSSLRFGSVSVAGDFTVSTTGTEHPNIVTSTLDPAQSVNRYWTLTNNSVTFVANANNRVIFTFVAADIDAGAATGSFFVGRYNAPTWTEITPSGRTATTTTISGVGITQANIAGDYAIGEQAPVVAPPGDFNAFETSTAANAITGRIFTKLVGVNFSLDIVAILSAAQYAGFTNTVAVDLVTGSTGGLNCPGAVAIAGTAQNVNLVSGRGTTAVFNIAGTAYRDVRVRVRYPVASPTVTSCSTDNFAIRPTGMTVISTNASGGMAATNTATTGAPAIRTGASFNLRATALPGYDGTPAINNALVTGTPTAGTIGGSFSAAAVGSGIADGNAFFYSEVGHFGLGSNAVFDSGFTAVDSGGGDCTNDFSNTPVGGRYGCSFGSAAVPQSTGVSGFGRFIPDNFAVSYNAPVLAPACTGFSYVGQSFTYTTVPVITVIARNGTNNGLTNATTVNYAGSYAKFTNATLAVAPYDTQAGRYTRNDALGGGLTPALDPSGLPATTADPVISAFVAGVGTLTFAGGSGLRFTRSATTPSAPFDADISLSLNVVDGDGVTFAGNPAAFGAATAGNGILFSDANAGTTNDKRVRYGRLRLGSSSGSQVLALRVPVEAQYWNGTSFITNTLDSCTVLAAGNVGLGNYTGSLNAGETTATASPLQSGRSAIQLSAPGAANFGGVDVTLNLGTGANADACNALAPAATAGNLAHLRGLWCTPPGTYSKDPAARVRFGVTRSSDQAIYRREQ
jgi:hypothetical protein